MNKQVKLYSVKMWVAKNEKEKKLGKEINDLKYARRSFKKVIKKVFEEVHEKGFKDWDDELKKLYVEESNNHGLVVDIDNKIKERKELLKIEAKKYDKEIRTIDTSYFKQKDIVSQFISNTIRALNINENELTDKFIIIETKNEEDIIMKQLILNGCMINNEKYIFFTASSGQIRNLKFIMIKESAWKESEKTLMCGLTIDSINNSSEKGCNVNKFLAYLALNNSASDPIEGFDIDRCIVVDDFTHIVNDKDVDFIDHKTWEITRKTMEVPIDFMDGAGICMPIVSKVNMQVRLPWVKGLLVPTPFHSFAKEEANNTKVVDIYGKEWDIVEDRIQIIFTKSQFKMWKYYNSWDEYKKFFKENNCIASYCKVDESSPYEYEDMRLSYQMYQTLTSMTDSEIENITIDTKTLINDAHYLPEVQLKLLGATEDNKKKDNLQKILYKYPELLSTEFIKKNISDIITSQKKIACMGKMRVKGTKRNFIVPDIYHFMSLLFKNEDNHLLNDGEIYCKLFKKDNKLAILRSPHLYREWGIVNNTYNTEDEDLKAKFRKYFITNATYCSNKTLLSKLLQMDWDGDEVLLVNDKMLVDRAEKDMQGIVPLYYEMGKAKAVKITNESIYESLKFAFENQTIGKTSNNLTVKWNKENWKENMDNIKRICAYNNYIIDAAKTLLIPSVTKEMKESLKSESNPYFFKYVKGEDEQYLDPMNESVMNRVCKSIDSIKYTKFVPRIPKNGFGKFNVNRLLSNSKVEITDLIIDKFNELKLEEQSLNASYKSREKRDGDKKFDSRELVSEGLNNSLDMFVEDNGLEYNNVADAMIKYAFKNDEMSLKIIFNLFGEYIVNNLEKNLGKFSKIDSYIICKCCGERTEKEKNKMYCKKCATKVNKEKTKQNKSKKKAS